MIIRSNLFTKPVSLIEPQRRAIQRKHQKIVDELFIYYFLVFPLDCPPLWYMVYNSSFEKLRTIIPGIWLYFDKKK